jgi:hypothetical protein
MSIAPLKNLKYQNLWIFFSEVLEAMDFYLLLTPLGLP